LKHPQMAAKYANTLQLWMKKKEAGEARAAKSDIAQSKQPLPIAA